LLKRKDGEGLVALRNQAGGGRLRGRGGLDHSFR